MLKLVIEDDEGRKTVVPFVREEITIGRQEGNTIRLTERNVSRRHARLMRHNGSVLVEDLGSYNGIRINGERIQGQVPVADGDLIQIGDYDLAIQHDAVQNAPPPAPSETAVEREDTAPTLAKANGAAHAHPQAAAPAPAPARDEAETEADLETVSDAEAEEASPDDIQSAPGIDPELARRQATSVIRIDQIEGNRPRQAVDIDAAEAPRLVALNTEIAGREFACIRSELKVGRTDDNDIAIDHRSLSRTHAKFVREDAGEWRVIDLQSANGLTVNGESYTQATLRHGDVVELGHVKLKFVGAGESFRFVPQSEGGSAPGKSPMMVPLIGGVAALVLLVGGGTLWYLLRDKPGEVQNPEVVENPVHVEPPPKVPPKVVEPKVVEPKAPPEATVEEKLAAAKAAIEDLDWDNAGQMLKSCKSESGALHPEAQTLLTQLKSETELRQNLDAAAKALEDGKLEEANGLLNESAHTKLLVTRYNSLRKQWKVASDQRLAMKTPTPVHKKPPETQVKPPPVKPAANGAAQEAQKLYEEGLLLLRSKQYREARTVLDRCLKADPTFAGCHKGLGSANAQLKDPEKGAYHYRKFLQLAPNDKDADKVRTILDAYEGTKK
ncbi:MAG: FHA domain-containing protein [Myxococcaceae bacterium]